MELSRKEKYWQKRAGKLTDQIRIALEQGNLTEQLQSKLLWQYVGNTKNYETLRERTRQGLYYIRMTIHIYENEKTIPKDYLNDIKDLDNLLWGNK